ncbi:hypothetical protein [Microbacterium phyllosphaerae]|uniref:hypothetical protein n=1 Tax=Microbacterium phyllosphaerae TaxID=124798 RepID=UPI00216A1014|nr:hypothetical protein [Microbacterium phyllosphaerae]MCS3444157.1 hypothetical protein [Microbacterium phyllosphaerae]
MTSTWWRTDALRWESQGWTLEVRGDEIAEIRHHGGILLRAVRAVVRDRGWATVSVAVLRIDARADSLVLSLQHEGLGALLSSTLTVRAQRELLSVVWSATNAVPFETCRAGLVALHPPSDAGRGVSVVHPDGSEERTAFPGEISPHQPIRGIRQLRIDEGPQITFSGDVFEMEDQRNWTDASFKTYSRPLDLPYPYALGEGETVVQSIVISAPAGTTGRVPSRADSRIDLAEAGVFPDIGVEASTAPDPVPSSSVGSFRVVELDLTTPTWRAALDRAVQDGPPLDVRLVTGADERQVTAAAEALASLPEPPLRVAAFDRSTHVTSRELGARVRAALRAAGVDAAFVSGARSHFTELNRASGSISRDADAMTVTMTPLFHAVDTEQLVESVAMQRLVAEQTVRAGEGLGVHIGPVSVRPRFNNVATAPEPAPTRDDLAEGYGAEFTGTSDERQTAPELGAWVVASAAALAVPGVRSLSWFETWGPRGIADDSGALPVADAVAALADLGGGALLSGDSPDGLVWAVGVRDSDTVVVLVANLDVVPRQVEIHLSDDSFVSASMAPGGWTRLSF